MYYKYSKQQMCASDQSRFESITIRNKSFCYVVGIYTLNAID